MDVLSDYASAELNIKNSRFLGEVIPVTSQNEARNMLKAQKEKYLDATHVVHAFAVGNNAEILGMSDDGEPAGTAGRPVLDVLKGRKCTNILLTVTRWFGGTLLGTGGLVKAYGDCAKAVLSAAQFHTLTSRRTFKFSVAYDLYEPVHRHLLLLGALDVTEQFDTAVTFSGHVPSAVAEGLSCFVSDLTRGTSAVTLGEEKYM